MGEIQILLIGRTALFLGVAVIGGCIVSLVWSFDGCGRTSRASLLVKGIFTRRKGHGYEV